MSPPIKMLRGAPLPDRSRPKMVAGPGPGPEQEQEQEAGIPVLVVVTCILTVVMNDLDCTLWDWLRLKLPLGRVDSDLSAGMVRAPRLCGEPERKTFVVRTVTPHRGALLADKNLSSGM